MGVTQKDVARLAGVSTATVSYVVNNGPRPVAEETRRRVLWAIELLDYRPSAVARSLVTRKTNTIGLLVPDILTPTHAAVATAFEHELRAAGYSLILGNSDESPDYERSYLRDWLSREADGIALTPTGANRRLLFSITDSGRPLVLLDRRLEGIRADCVLSDNVVGAHRAVRHLIGLGHTRIGLINLPHSSTPGAERLEGYRNALLEAGIKVDSELIAEGTPKPQDGRKLAESLLGKSPSPTALFVSGSRLMRGVLRTVRELRLRVPEDLALVTFDDISDYADRTPSITAVATPFAQLGSVAAQILIDRVSGAYGGELRIVRPPCELRVRESTVGGQTPGYTKAQ